MGLRATTRQAACQWGIVRVESKQSEEAIRYEHFVVHVSGRVEANTLQYYTEQWTVR